MQSELKSCPDPECRSTDIQVMHGAPGCHWVFCRACGLQTSDGGRARKAAQWNRLPRPTASNLPADSNLQKTQIAPDVVEEVREALANLISVAERNIYPQPDKVNSDYAKLVSAKSALTKLSAMPSGEPAPDVVAALNDTQWQINVVEGCIRKENPKMADRLLELFGRNHAVLSRLSAMPIGWRPQIGERVHAAPHVPDSELWNRKPMFVSGISYAKYSAGALDITIAEEWPPVGVLTDGYLINKPDGSPDDIRQGAPLPTPPEGEK